jgi:hypothetical protein
MWLRVRRNWLRPGVCLWGFLVPQRLLYAPPERLAGLTLRS